MKQLEFFHSYSQEPEKRAGLVSLFEAAFGIPPEFFATLFDRGFWDPTYRPLSLFAEERAVANVSLFDMPIVLEGKKVRAAGVQSVMTSPDFRGQGLVRQLFEELLRRYEQEYELFFLYARDHEIYEKFGFRLVPQSHFLCEKVTRAVGAFAPLRKLDVQNDADCDILKNLFAKRRPVSAVFGLAGQMSPFFFATLATTAIQIAYLPDQDAAVAYELQDGVLHLYDIVGEQIPILSVLLSGMDLDVERVEVYFTPDLLQTPYTAFEPTTYAKLMVRGPFPGKLLFQLPPTAEF